MNDYLVQSDTGDDNVKSRHRTERETSLAANVIIFITMKNGDYTDLF